MFAGSLFLASLRYFTRIFSFAFLRLKVLTVIVAVPFFNAITFPLAVTFATDGLFEENIILLLVAPVGFNFTLILNDFPFFSVFDFAFNEIFFGAFLTMTWIRAAAFGLFAEVTVIQEVPAFLPVILPFAFMETFLLLAL